MIEEEDREVDQSLRNLREVLTKLTKIMKEVNKVMEHKVALAERKTLNTKVAPQKKTRFLKSPADQLSSKAQKEPLS